MTKLLIAFFVVCAAFPELPAQVLDGSQEIIGALNHNSGLESFAQSNQGKYQR